jgi:hypothetical protein
MIIAMQAPGRRVVRGPIGISKPLMGERALDHDRVARTAFSSPPATEAIAGKASGVATTSSG